MLEVWKRSIGKDLLCARYATPDADPDAETMESMMQNGYYFRRDGKRWEPKPLRKRSGKTENAASEQQVRLF